MDTLKYRVDFLLLSTVEIEAGDDIEAEEVAAKLLPARQQAKVQMVRISGNNALGRFYKPDAEWWKDSGLAEPKLDDEVTEFVDYSKKREGWS